jgi:hypothetical protein
MYGPNTNTSGGSIIVYHEAQAALLRQALQHVRGRPRSRFAPRSRRQATGRCRDRFAGTAWTGCDSWYRDARGRIVANWPGYMREYVERTATLDPGEYAFVAAPDGSDGFRATPGAQRHSGEIGTETM